MLKLIFLFIMFGLFSTGSALANQPQTEYWKNEKCRLNITRLNDQENKSFKFIFLNGVPVTSLIYEGLAKKINSKLGAEVELIDIPGTGLSRNSGYSWSASERCIHAYLKEQKKNFILLVHDIAGPIALPALADSSLKVKGAVILNTILSPENFKPVFPLNLIRAPLVGAVISPLVPFFYFEKEMRSKGIARNETIKEERIRALYDDFSYSFGKFRLHRVMRGFELTHERDQRIKAGLESSIPKLTIWGLSDPSLGGQFEYVSRIRNNRIVKISEAKHFLMLDYSDEIFGSIRKFVRLF